MPTAQKLRLIRDTCKVSQTAVFGFGVAAGGVITLLTALLRGLRVWSFNVELFLGSLMTQRSDSATWWIGFTLYLFICGLAAYGYALIFRSAHRSGPTIGVNLAFYHWAISGLLLGFASMAHAFHSPGFFMVLDGFVPSVVFFFAHLLYGAILGSLFDWAAIRRQYPKPLSSFA